MFEINEEGRRLLINLAQHYDIWMAAERRLATARLQWKTIHGKDYLYRLVDRDGNGTSLGPRAESTERQFEDYRNERARRDEIEQRLAIDAALYRALRLPQLPSFAGEVLRELDRRAMLGTSFLVVGTNALVAYAIEGAQMLPPDMGTTDDFDLTWAGEHTELPNALFAALKHIDATYTVNEERQFQVRNARGYEIELLLPARLADKWGRSEKIRPIPLPEQDWLLNGRPVSQVVCDMGAKPARVVAPDPRWFGLHKLWLSQKPSRHPLKIAKDERQGFAVLDMVAKHMPHFPLDAAFRADLPAELRPHFERWAARG